MSAPDPLIPSRDDQRPFGEPWQAQAFALALELHGRGAFTWAEWAQALSARLKAAGEADDGGRYYEHWLAALEDLTVAKRLAAPDELSERRDAWAAAYRRTPHGRPVQLADPG